MMKFIPVLTDKDVNSLCAVWLPDMIYIFPSRKRL